MATADRGAGARTAADRSPAQWFALVFGIIYLLIGIIGFFITGFDNFFGNETPPGAHHVDENLLGFMINPMHNVVHILIGAAGIALSRTLAGARTYGWLLAVGYGAAFVYGLIAIGKDWAFLNINAADNVLHIATAVVGLVMALGPVNTAARTSRV